MRTKAIESSMSSRTPEVKGAPMQQMFFLLLTATAGLLVALALALAAFPGVAAALLDCPAHDPTCEVGPEPPAPTVTVDRAIVEVTAGDTARNTGHYFARTDSEVEIKATPGIVTPSGNTGTDMGPWSWEIVTECVPVDQVKEFPVTITAKDLNNSKTSSTTFKVIVHGTQACGPQPQPETIIENYRLESWSGYAEFYSTSTQSDYDHFRCNLDSAEWKPCPRTQKYYNLADGEHSFEVKAVKCNLAVDRGCTTPVGEASTAKRTWTVDKPPPVIFLPGVMGSKLGCGEGENYNELWPDIPDPDVGSLLLQEDGVTDMAAAAAPPGWSPPCLPQVSGVFDRILIDLPWPSPDVEKIFYESRTAKLRYVYPYDWRKSPEYATNGLDQLVDRALRETGNDKVAILAHSMGGLVTRHYIDDPTRAQKVERVVTLGTPYWGSPKTWGMLAHGQTSPTFNALDLIIDNDEARLFARNSSGFYSLFPSDSYLNATHGWLTYTNRNGGNPLDTMGTMNAIASLDDPGGNWQLAQNARSLHGNHLDSFATDVDANGRVNGVDYRVLVGSGLVTPTKVTEDPGAWLADTKWTFGNGDESVPLVSAKADAEGSRVPIINTCGIVHDQLARDKVVEKLVGFLVGGSDPGQVDIFPHPDMCAANGNAITVHATDIDGAQIQVMVEEKTTPRRMPLKQAEAEGLVDVIEDEGQTLLVTNDHQPVSLSVSGEDIAIEDTRVEDSQELDPVAFKPTDGEVTIRPGDATSVKLGGFDESLQAPPVAEVPLDKTAPVTTVNARRSGESFFLSANAQDDSGVQATYHRIGEEEPKKWEGEIEVPAAQLGSVRFGSVDVYGNNESERTLTVDNASPKVSSATPANNATGVKRNINLTATFSERMDPSTLTNSTFQLFKVNTDGSTTQVTNVTVAPSTDGLKATLNPFGTSTTLLAKSTKYKAVVSTGAKDVTGNPLDQNPTTSGNQQMVWSFKTGLQ